VSAWKPPHPPTAASMAHLDPYLEFAEETDDLYLRAGSVTKPQGTPLLIEIRMGEYEPGKERTAQAFAKEWGADVGLTVPPAYRHPPESIAKARYLTAFVDKAKFFSALGDKALRLHEWVERVAPALPVDEDLGAYSASYAPIAPGPAVQKGIVVTGVIDDGLAFAHEHFRTGLRTRFACVWDQNSRRKGSGGKPVGFTYGNELSRKEINDHLAAFSTSCGVDEESLYRAYRSSLTDRLAHFPLARAATHGAHVMDLATRLEPGQDAGLWPLIGVQLPFSTTADTSGATLVRYLLDGLRYIIDRADQLANGKGALPIVVNVSYGLIAGPHNGTSIIELAIDELIRARNGIAPFLVVLPAGNNLLSRCHASFLLESSHPRVLRWRVQPDDRTPSFLEIWLPEISGAHAQVSVSVTSPTNLTSGPVIEGQVCELEDNRQIIAKIIYLNGVLSPLSRKRNVILIAIAPTATLDPGKTVAPAGAWTVSITNQGNPVQIDAWIQRDDAAPGYPTRGRQSYFDDAEYVRYDWRGRLVEDDTNPPNTSYVKRDSSINAIATGAEAIVVAGHSRKNGAPARTSSSGPALPKGIGMLHRDGPEAMAPSEDSPALRNVLAAGTRSGSVAAMNGTSAAAPLVTRWIAGEMMNGRRITRADVYNEAQSAEQNLWQVSAPSKKRGGGGRLRLAPAVKRGIES